MTTLPVLDWPACIHRGEITGERCECNSPRMASRDVSIRACNGQAFGLSVCKYLETDTPTANAPAGPSLPRKALNYAVAQVKHVAGGCRSVSDETYVARIRTCLACPSLSDDGALNCLQKACGCPVRDKAQRLAEDCPLGKWP